MGASTMHHGDEYFDAFTDAAQKSVEFGLIRAVPERLPDLGRAINAFDLVGRMIDSLPYESTKIRTMCGQIHAQLWRWLREEEVSCLVTIGDIEVSGVREFETTYEQLELELSGALRSSTRPYPFHVWLTFPDGHIVDVTYFVYKHHDLLPMNWRWSRYVVCSDHSFSRDLDIRYVPYLVGDATMVERIIFDGPLAKLKGGIATPQDFTNAVAALSAYRKGAAPLSVAGRAAPGKIGRNAPCPCGSGRKAKQCHGTRG
ncbi:hypothetical protein DRW03_36285 [Corallococcus sp. H22C18031201]|nr:hypothetical protein DRW03_36285 [Corallococcus sp. H22C18031201]